MLRRDLLKGFALGAAGLLLPERYQRQRAYSFIALPERRVVHAGKLRIYAGAAPSLSDQLLIGRTPLAEVDINVTFSRTGARFA